MGIPLVPCRYEDYYQMVLSLEQIQKRPADPESETHFVHDHHQEICGFR